VHGPRLGHAIITRPGAVILMPLPDIAVELGLRIHLELVHVELLAEHLLDRFDETRVSGEDAERLVVGVRSERRAGCAGLLAPYLLPALVEDLLGLATEHRDLFL